VTAVRQSDIGHMVSRQKKSFAPVIGSPSQNGRGCSIENWFARQMKSDGLDAFGSILKLQPRFGADVGIVGIVMCRAHWPSATLSARLVNKQHA
jgi:hypothetical protein